MEEKIPTFECTVGNFDKTGIMAVSFVEMPAIESNFIALKKPIDVRLKVNRQKQLLTGALLIPDQLIYRNDNERGEYYITFSKEEIEKIAQKMMRNRESLGKTTHQHEKALQGNHLAELWLVSNPKQDKSVALGLGELPAGTLMVSYKIEDPAYWQKEVLTGNVKGFSLEGMFNFNSIKMKKKVKNAADKTAKKPKLTVFGQALHKMGVPVFMEGETEEEAEDLVDEAKKDEVDAGDPFLIFELADGNEAWVDADGFATLDGEQMPAGEHALADGNFIVIDDSGMLVVTQPEADSVEPEAAAAELAKKAKQAKARGKQFLAKAGGSKEAQIAALKKQIAILEKQPSAEKAEPTVAGAGKKPEEMTHTEKMAAVIRSRNERRKK